MDRLKSYLTCHFARFAVSDRSLESKGDDEYLYTSASCQLHKPWPSEIIPCCHVILFFSKKILQEFLFHLCDARTRQTRKLIKIIAILDFDNFSIFRRDGRFAKVKEENIFPLVFSSNRVLREQAAGEASKV